MRRIAFSLAGAILLLSLAAARCMAQADGRPEDRPDPLHGNSAIPPFKIIGNIYYVGLSDQTSYLITTPQGHFLIDQTWEGGVPQIRKNVEQLGFKMKDIKYLLNAHAHIDHVQGLAEMKELTGAKVLVMDADAPAIADGGASTSRNGNQQWKPVRVDQTLHDGQELKMGGVTLVAHKTAGHTPGCTTWSTVVEDNGRKYNVVSVCGLYVNPGVQLVGNKKYPNIVEDFEKSFALLKGLPCNIFLASHGAQFGLTEKLKRLAENPGQNPFLDPQGYKDYLTRYEADFRAELKKQQAAVRN